MQISTVFSKRMLSCHMQRDTYACNLSSVSQSKWFLLTAISPLLNFRFQKQCVNAQVQLALWCKEWIALVHDIPILLLGPVLCLHWHKPCKTWPVIILFMCSRTHGYVSKLQKILKLAPCISSVSVPCSGSSRICVSNLLIIIFFFFYFNLINRSQIVECLSSIVRDDTLKDTDHTISEDCRKQLKVELLERVSG